MKLFSKQNVQFPSGFETEPFDFTTNLKQQYIKVRVIK